MKTVHLALFITSAASLGCHERIAGPRMPEPVLAQEIRPRARPVLPIDAGPVVTGFVVDSQTGKPLEGSRLVLVDRVRGRDSVAEIFTTRSDGRFALKPLSAGRYVLRILALGYEWEERTVTIRPETAGPPVTIPMLIFPGCTWEDIVVMPVPDTSRHAKAKRKAPQ